MYTQTMIREWDIIDTPIPKVGETLTRMDGEQWRVVYRKKYNTLWEIVFVKV